MKLSFQQKQDLSNSIQGVLNLNQDMNNILVGILKSTEKELIRTDNDIDKSTIYAFVFDDYFTNYTEKKVLAVAVFEGRYVGVLVGENNETLEGMTDDAILEMNMLGHTFFMFKDIVTEEINVVYKRKDGNYGLLNPE